jgi:hypothetical protein
MQIHSQRLFEKEKAINEEAFETQMKATEVSTSVWFSGDPNTPAYEEVDRIVSQFKKAISENPNKEVITYCYSAACMTGRKVGKMLSDNGVFVKTLNIGWNEWKYFWTLWNHEHEWKSTKPENYIVVGKEPGTPTQRSLPSPCGDGELGC